MTLLAASPVWADVPRLEVSTPAQGGPLGAMTAQAQAIVNRMQYLRVVSDRHVGLLGASGTAAEARSLLGLPDVTAAYPNRGGWTTGTAYAVNDLVVRSSVVYQCTVAHTAGTFNTDQSAGYWAIYQGLRLADIQVSGGAALVGYGSTTVAAQLDTLVAGAATTAAGISRLDVWRTGTHAGTTRLGLGNFAVAENLLVGVAKATVLGDAIVDAYQWQRHFDTPITGWTGAKACQRFISYFGTPADDVMTIGTAWTVNAIADLKPNVQTSESVSALSGVIFKRGQYQHAIAGHFQVRDYVDFGTSGVTPTVCSEMNITAFGPDSTTENDGFGNRFCLNIFSYTNMQVAGAASNRAEIGAGIRIQPAQTDTANDGAADFRNGLVVRDQWQFGKPRRITKSGVHIATAGEHGLYVKAKASVAAVMLADGDDTYGQSNYGLIADGRYLSGTAIRIRGGQAIALESTNAITFSYNASNGRIEFKNGTAVKGWIDMNGTAHAL